MIEHFVKNTLSKAEHGSRVKGQIPIGTMSSGMEIGIPFVVVKGRHDGPCLWINGQVHGVEINGIFSALEFINSISPENLSGSIVVTATANPLALDAREKNAPQDGYDLDQSYPGNKFGFLTERISYIFFEEVKVCANLLINMHTNAPFFEGKPYAVYKQHPNGVIDEGQILKYISAFNPTIACRMSTEPNNGELLGNISGAIDYQLLALGIPSFMIELGGGSRSESEYIAQGLTGFRGVASQLGMIDHSITINKMIYKATRRRHVTLNHGGLFRAYRKPGEFVKAGESLGVTINMYGEIVEEPVSENDAIVICIRRDPVVHVGDRFVFLAEKWSVENLIE